MLLSVSDLPKFNGHHYKQWVDKMAPVMMLLDIKAVLEGTLIPPSAITVTEPQIPVVVGSTVPTLTDWVQYNALLLQYNSQYNWHRKAQKDYNKKNLKALGVLNICLSTGIWNQVKDMTAANAWTWLHTSYARIQFIKVLEDFRILTTFKLDLSDPNPQIARFYLHYTRLPEQTPTIPVGQPAATPVPIVSQSMACLILLSSLPCAMDPAQQESVYQRTMEDYTSNNPISNMTLNSLTNHIRTTWAARFGHLPDSQKPRKGTFYINKGDKQLSL